MRRIRRPFSVLTAVGTAAHHGYELASGVGIVAQPELGLRGALALWGVSLPTWAGLAARGTSRWDRLIAALAGVSLAGVATHYLLWPVEVRRGIPFLSEAEGLEPRQLRAYNAVLHGWALAGAASLLAEVPRGQRRWALAGLATMPLAKAGATYHFRWAHEQAETNPAWWNRGLQGKPPVAARGASA